MTAACRFCGATLQFTVCDLGMSPLSNAYLEADQLHSMEAFYPLRAYVCDRCFLVQLDEFESPQKIFADYAYFSSYSDSWLEHCRNYAGAMQARLGLDESRHVVEIASNDGYLLQYFAQLGIPVLGVEPAANVAAAALKKGIPTLVRFFGVGTAKEMAAAGQQADLLLGNNVLAHVPNINDFVEGMALVLKPGGVITMEFPHLLRLMQNLQFDTIYHEHFSYFSLLSVERIFSAHGLQVFDVEELPTHGGSLRIYCRHTEGGAVSDNILAMRRLEIDAGLEKVETYASFAGEVAGSKRDLLAFMIAAKRDGRRIAAYGAPAKGNTLLNYCGIRQDFIEFTVDRSPEKQGRFLPGTHIPVHAPERIFDTRPDYLLILPWNIKDEIIGKMSGIREWGGKFVIPIPSVEVLE
jgi:2-polyprenyl-3-methyl-5-hydroxy-6-metoxy-1,4-benzoquinol methylase